MDQEDRLDAEHSMKIFKNENERYNFFLLSGCLLLVFWALFGFVYFNINAYENFHRKNRELCQPGIVEKVVEAGEEQLDLLCTDGEKRWIKRRIR